MTLTINNLKNKSKDEIAQMLGLTDDLPPSKEAALERLSKLGIPTKKSEEYRYFDVESLFDKDHELHLHLPKEPKIGEKIVIENGIIVEVPRCFGSDTLRSGLLSESPSCTPCHQDRSRRGCRSGACAPLHPQ